MVLESGARCFLKGLGGGVGGWDQQPHGNHYGGTLTNNPPIHHMLLTAVGHVRSGVGGGRHDQCCSYMHNLSKRRHHDAFMSHL